MAGRWAAAVEWAVLGLVLASVFLFGAVEEEVLVPVATALLVMAAALALAGHLPGRPTPLDAPLAAFVILTALYLVPLPSALACRLSPALCSLRADLGVPVRGWLRLSVAPDATQLALLRAGAAAALYLLATRFLATPASLRRLVAFLVALGTAEAAYGLFNFLLGNHHLLWLRREHYTCCATGTLVNRNHFAGLMAMLLPSVPALYWLTTGRHRLARGEGAARATCFVVLGTLMGLALIFSKSRGGLAAFIASFGLFLAVTRSPAEAAPARGARALPLALLGAILLYGSLTALDQVLARFGSLGAEITHGRPELWRDALGIVRDYPLLGAGPGTFAHLFPAYKQSPVQSVFSHAHNDYLELATELGIAGLGCLLWGGLRLARLLWPAIRRLPQPPAGAEAGPEQARLVTAALTTSLVAIAIHSVFDFNLQIPGNAFVLVLLLAAAVRVAEAPELAMLPRRRRVLGRHRPRPGER